MMISQRMMLRYFLSWFDKLIYIEGSMISDKKRKLIMELHRSSNKRLDNLLQLGLKKYGYY